MRTYISAGIFKHSVASLQAESGYPVGLCKRLLMKKCLWLIRISTEDICRMHEADLLNRFNPISQGLDIVELAAIYAQLPDKFLVDASGKKERYRESIVGHLKELMAKKEKGVLAKSQTRNVLYSNVVSAYVSSRQSMHSISCRVSEVPSASSSTGASSSSQDTLNPILASLPPQPLPCADASTGPGGGAPTFAPVGSTAQEEARKAGTNRPPPAFTNALEAMVKKRQTSVTGSDTDTSAGVHIATNSSSSSGTRGQRPPPAFADAIAAMSQKRKT